MNDSHYYQDYSEGEQLIPASQVGREAGKFSLNALKKSLLAAAHKGDDPSPIIILRELLAYDEVRAIFRHAEVDVDTLIRGIGFCDHREYAREKRIEKRREKLAEEHKFESSDGDEHDATRVEKVYDFIDGLKRPAVVAGKREPGAVAVLKKLLQKSDPHEHCGFNVFRDLDITPARLFPELGRTDIACDPDADERAKAQIWVDVIREGLSSEIRDAKIKHAHPKGTEEHDDVREDEVEKEPHKKRHKKKDWGSGKRGENREDGYGRS